jgi:hypothetical protein
MSGTSEAITSLIYYISLKIALLSSYERLRERFPDDQSLSHANDFPELVSGVSCNATFSDFFARLVISLSDRDFSDAFPVSVHARSHVTCDSNRGVPYIATVTPSTSTMS